MSEHSQLELKRVYLPQDLGFREAIRSDYAFLYSLLVERYEKETANISGMAWAALPGYEEHVEHLERSPYKRLEIVEAHGLDAGMMYVSDTNVGGCFIARNYSGRGIGLAACYSFFQDCEFPVIAHINTRNRPACRTVDRLGFVKTEELAHRSTFELRGPPKDPFPGVRARLSGQE